MSALDHSNPERDFSTTSEDRSAREPEGNESSPGTMVQSVVTDEKAEECDANADDQTGNANLIAFRAFLLGLAAATTYSIANLALRGLSRADGSAGWDMWVAGTKAFPTFAVAIVLLSIRVARREQTFASWSFVWPIAVAALFNQLGGNFAFQLSLGTIGLAISVPICFASIICSGAIVGRMVLNDPVSVRTGVSMGLMVASIVFLSAAAQSRSADDDSAAAAKATTDVAAVPAVDGQSVTIPEAAALSMNDLSADPAHADETVLEHQRRRIMTGVALSILSGLCYGVTGVFIRKAVRSQMPVAATLFLFSAAGFLVLCPLSLVFLPSGAIAGMTRSEWITVAIAGTFNAIGFFAITHAMKYMTISRANVINASQNAMCAIGAVLVFAESLTMTGLVGIGLTIAGLLALDRR